MVRLISFSIFYYQRLLYFLISFCNVSLKSHETAFIAKFEKDILQFNEVVECYHIAGMHDYLLKVMVKDMDEYESFADETFKRLKTIAKIAEDGGVICVLENCSGWASGSYEHTLRTLEAVNSPALKLVFDTGNPVFDDDVRKYPYKKQDSWEFYNAVKDHIVYIHIKDGYMDGDKEAFTFPGEGNGCVKKIVADLLKNGYDGGFSIEPHMAVVFHNQSVKSEADIRYNNYIEYGKRFMKIVDEIKKNICSTI